MAIQPEVTGLCYGDLEHDYNGRSDNGLDNVELGMRKGENDENIDS